MFHQDAEISSLRLRSKQPCEPSKALKKDVPSFELRSDEHIDIGSERDASLVPNSLDNAGMQVVPAENEIPATSLQVASIEDAPATKEVAGDSVIVVDDHNAFGCLPATSMVGSSSEDDSLQDDLFFRLPLPQQGAVKRAVTDETAAARKARKLQEADERTKNALLGILRAGQGGTSVRSLTKNSIPQGQVQELQPLQN